MNFEERKAEIFRRGQQQIAQRRRKRRMILGAVVPIALIAVLTVPAIGLLEGMHKKEAPRQMGSLQLSRGDKESISLHNPTAPATPQETVPEIDFGYSFHGNASADISPLPELRDDPMVSEDIPYSDPPAITITTAEGASGSPIVISRCWPIVEGGKAYGYSTQKAANVLYPGVVNIAVTTKQLTLELDTLAVAPSSITVECWPTSEISLEYNRVQPASQSVSAVALSQGENQCLYKIGLLPGSYVYQVHLDWPFGFATYAFIATVE